MAEIGRFPFRFECQRGCVNCCTKAGHVYLTPADRDRIADWLGLSAAEFESRYCEGVDDDLRLTNPSETACWFLEEGGCAIHPVKPLQCRTFPFWPENVKTKRAWKNLRSYCPGVGVGQILPVEEVRRQVEETAEAFPEGAP